MKFGKISKIDPNSLQGRSLWFLSYAVIAVFLLVLGICINIKLLISLGTAITGVFGGIFLLLLVWDAAARKLKGISPEKEDKPYTIKAAYLITGELLVVFLAAVSMGFIAYVSGLAEISIAFFSAALPVAAIWLAAILACRLSKERLRKSRYNFAGAIESTAFDIIIMGIFFWVTIHVAETEALKESLTVRLMEWDLATIKMLVVTWMLAMCAMYLVSAAVELATRGRRESKNGE